MLTDFSAPSDGTYQTIEVPGADGPSPAARGIAEGDLDTEDNSPTASETSDTSDSSSTDGDLLLLLEYLKSHRGFDFTGYKRTSLVRRIERRMQIVGIEGFENYIDYLEVHPDEFAHLFNMILINVTAFFRDAAAWEYVAAEILPRIVGQKGADDPIRVWSAGCASGEESGTLAILLAELLGMEAFRRRVKIYATDVDEEALTEARQAGYSARSVVGIPDALRDKYFEEKSGRFTLDKDLRRAIIFGRNDLLKDAPISRIDLLVCRNTLMYFNAEVQGQVLHRFHFALGNNGFLFLGKAEMLLTHGDLFAPVELKRRVFARVPKGFGADQGIADMSLVRITDSVSEPVQKQLRLREQVFEIGPVAQIVVSETGVLTLANEQVRSLFRLGTYDVGRMLKDLELSYRPVDLRSCIDSAYAERTTVEIKDVAYHLPGAVETIHLDIRIQPLLSGEGAVLGASLTFTDVTSYKRLQMELEESNRELETAYEELQSINEELETTNEELQSTVEELETTNEELQSTNEELETMNEELQSTNEELQTINEELQTRSAELNQVNAFLASILTSLRGGVVVVDNEMHVQIWNHKSEDLWGLRSEEVNGKHLLNLDFGLPVEDLRNPLRSCLAGQTPAHELTRPATNRKGRAIRCRVSCTPLRGTGEEIMGAILVMQEE